MLSCGQILAGSPGATVVTVFTAGPASWGEPTAWDASCGFTAGADVIAARKAEDAAALALLGAQPVWLEVTERQYGGTATVEQVAATLTDALAGVSGADVLVPLGLTHPEHVKVADAGAAALAARPDLRGWVYADQPYSGLDPAALAERSGARRLGSAAAPALPVGDLRWKRAALRRYRSQMVVLRASVPLALLPERYWPLDVVAEPPTMAG